MSSEIEITIGSGNVFADIGHPDPEEALTKAKLFMCIRTAIENRGLKRKEVAKLLHIAPKQLSSIIEGELLDEITVGQLIDYLCVLDENTEIIVRDAYGPVQFRVATG